MSGFVPEILKEDFRLEEIEYEKRLHSYRGNYDWTRRMYGYGGDAGPLDYDDDEMQIWHGGVQGYSDEDDLPFNSMEEQRARESYERDSEEFYSLVQTDFDCTVYWYDISVQEQRMKKSHVFKSYKRFEEFCESEGLVLPLTTKYDAWESKEIHACLDLSDIALGTTEYGVMWDADVNVLKSNINKVFSYINKWSDW